MPRRGGNGIELADRFPHVAAMHDFSRYTFGTMSLGKQPAYPEADLAVVRRAMEAGVWFHSSPTYNNGFTFMVLRMAFDAARQQVPRLIVKIRDGSPRLMRFEAEDSCRRLGLDHLEVGQLVSMHREPGNLADQLCAGRGPLVDELASLKQRGLIRRAVLFFDRHNAEAAATAAQHPLIDGVTLYWNALQWDCTPAAWAILQKNQTPVLALRTMGGPAEDGETKARRLALHRALPGVDETALALGLAASEPLVRTTIGGTASLAHLEQFLSAAQHAAPLEEEALRAVDAIRRA